MRALTAAVWLVATVAVGCAADDGPGEPTGFEDGRTGGVEVLRAADGRVLSVRGRFEAPSGGGAEARARAFVDARRDALRLADGIALGAVSVSGTDIQTVVFELTAGGVPIEAARLRVRLTPDEVFFVSVSAPSRVPEVLEPALDAAGAAAAAEGAAGGASLGEPVLVVHAPSLWTGGAPSPRLAWRVPVQRADAPSAPVVFVDAVDGAELGRLETVRLARDRRIYDSHGYYGDANLNDYRTLVYDESGVAGGATPWEEATVAWMFAETACDYLQSAFSDDAPCNPLVVYLRYGDPQYAAMDRGALQFGEGALTDPDEGYRTFVHELGHALVWHRSDTFPYYGESGAVQEALADVISMLASMPAQWVVDPGAPYERNLSNPGAAGNPTTYAGRATGDADNGETHENSVLLSHALWLATVEGVDVGGTHVSGMGADSMASILDELLSGYVGQGAITLHQAAASLVDSCMVHPMFRDVFGLPAASVTFRDCGLLLNALAEVGLAQPDGDLDGWPDDSDDCPVDTDPYQEDGDGDGVGDACDTDGPPPDDRMAYPATPDALPTCPETIPTGLADDPTWSFAETLGPRLKTVSNATTLGVESYYELQCLYRSSVMPDYQQYYRLLWQPRDPDVYETASFYFCDPDAVPAVDRDRALVSTTRQARAQVANAGACCDGITPEQHYANLSAMLEAAEAVALPCP